MVIQTSKFFLSDEREAVEMPLRRENDRPVTHRKLYIHRLDTGAQMIKETHGVGGSHGSDGTLVVFQYS